MKRYLKIFTLIAIAAFTYSLTGCAAPATSSYKNIGVTLKASPCGQCEAQQFIFNTVAPQPTPIANSENYILTPGAILDLPMNGGGTNECVFYTATVTNAPTTNLTWTIYPQASLLNPYPLPSGTTNPPNYEVGFFSNNGNTTPSTPGVYVTQTGLELANGTSNFYCPPLTPPIYSGATLLQAQQMGIPQGDVMITVSAPTDPSNPSAVATASTMLQIYEVNSTAYIALVPSTPKGDTNNAVTVSHSSPSNTYTFAAIVVGTPPCATAATCGSSPTNTTDNTVTWEVGFGGSAGGSFTGVVGGSTTYGTIVPITCPASLASQLFTSCATYTAPAAIPAVPPVVVAVAHSNAAVVADAYVNIN